MSRPGQLQLTQLTYGRMLTAIDPISRGLVSTKSYDAGHLGSWPDDVLGHLHNPGSIYMLRFGGRLALSLRVLARLYIIVNGSPELKALGVSESLESGNS
jgi:hypothetical protein